MIVVIQILISVSCLIFFVGNKYVIEYDGAQHFHYTENGLGVYTEKLFRKIQFSDNFKNDYCREHNIPIIRIPYTHYDNLCLEDLMLETSKFIVQEVKKNVG